MSQPKAKFLQGDLMRHIVVMSMSASLGLVSIFAVDFLDLFFISLLGQAELAAAVGFAGTLIFFNMSITIGLMIAVSALAARAIGRGEPEEARRIATSVLTLGLGFGVIVAAVFWLGAPLMLDGLGAAGETKALATRYLRFIVPTLPVMVTGMVASGLLRAHGDARRAMNATLAAGAVNAILDPIFIFGLGLGLDGAALASVAARFATMITALWPVFRHYGGFARFEMAHFKKDLSPILGIAAPAILTNVATPVGNMFITRAIAAFGDAAVAGFAVIGRMTPLAFCVIFALSGAVGPIIGQNFGAGDFSRVRQTIRKAMLFTGGYTAVMWAVLFLMQGVVADLFNLVEEGRDLIFWYGAGAAPLFFFSGALFVANASFNNLNRPLWSTWLNWGKNTVGTIPFVMIGGAFFGAPGVLIGPGVGSIVFGLIGFFLAMRLSRAYETGAAQPGKAQARLFRAARTDAGAAGTNPAE